MSEAAWRKAVEKVLKGAAFESLEQQSPDGLVFAPLLPSRRNVQPLARQKARPRNLSLLVARDSDANDKALEDLNNGADGLAVDCDGAGPAQLERLLRGVEIDLIALRLINAGADLEQALHALTLLRGLNPASLDLVLVDGKAGSFRFVEIDADVLASIARMRAALSLTP